MKYFLFDLGLIPSDKSPPANNLQPLPSGNHQNRKKKNKMKALKSNKKMEYLQLLFKSKVIEVQWVMYNK